MERSSTTSTSIIQSSALKAITQYDGYMRLVAMAIGSYFLGPYFSLVSPDTISNLQLMTAGASILFAPQIVRGTVYTAQRLGQSIKNAPAVMNAILSTGVAGGSVLFLLFKHNMVTPESLISSIRSLLNKGDTDPTGKGLDWLKSAVDAFNYCLGLLGIADVNITVVEQFMADYIYSTISGTRDIFKTVVFNDAETIARVRMESAAYNATNIAKAGGTGIFFGLSADQAAEINKTSNATWTAAKTAEWLADYTGVSTFQEFIKAQLATIGDTTDKLMGNKPFEGQGTASTFQFIMGRARAWLTDIQDSVYGVIKSNMGEGTSLNISDANLITICQCVGFILTGILVTWLSQKLYSRFTNKGRASAFDMECLQSFANTSLAALDTSRQLFVNLIDEYPTWDTIMAVSWTFIRKMQILDDEAPVSCMNYNKLVSDTFVKLQNIYENTNDNNRYEVVIGYLRLLENMTDIITEQTAMIKENGDDADILFVDKIRRRVVNDFAFQKELILLKIDGKKVKKTLNSLDRSLFVLTRASKASGLAIGRNEIREDMLLADY